MEGENLIPVRVSGNPVGNSGFQTLVELNNPSFDNEDKTLYQGFRDCQYFFSIMTEKTQTVYRLVRNGAKSFCAIRLGVLIISFSIHKGYKLAGGKTPYDVLCRLMDVFLSRGMTLQSSGDYEYKDRNTCEYGEILKDVVAEFNLERETAVRHYPMVGSDIGLIIRSEEDIKELFKDITYPEFASYNEIFVATKPSSSPASYKVLNVTIPRPRIYKIYSKGLHKKDVTNTNESILVQSDKPSDYYDTTQKSFTINQLLNGVRINGVEIDPIEERVDVTPSLIVAPAREKLVEIEIRPAEMRDKINMNNFVVSDGNGHQLKQRDGKLFLRAEEIALIRNPRVTAFIINDDSHVLNTNWEGEKVVVYVKEKEKPKPPVTQGGGWGSSSGGANNVFTFDEVDYTIRLRSDFFKRKDSPQREVILKVEGRNGEKTHYFKTVKFESKVDGYEGTFHVPKKPTGPVTFVIETKKKTYEKKGNPNDRVVENFEEKASTGNSKVYLCLVVALVMFILGCAAGYIIPDLIRTNKEVKEFLKKANEKLKSDDLSIADIESLYNEYCANETVYKKFDDNNFYDRIEGYHNLSRGIKTGDVGIIKTYTKDSLFIYESHRHMIGLIVQDSDSEKWFKMQNSAINSLRDIEKIYEHQCNVCKQYFKDEDAYDKHKTPCANKGCPEKFCPNDKEAMDKHKKEHTSTAGRKGTGSSSNNKER